MGSSSSSTRKKGLRLGATCHPASLSKVQTTSSEDYRDNQVAPCVLLSELWTSMDVNERMSMATQLHAQILLVRAR